MIDTMKRTSTRQYIVIKVRGPLSIITGEKLEVPFRRVMSIKDLHKYLVDKYMDIAEEKGLMEVIKNLDSQNLILVNGREINTLDGLETHISPGDEVVIINYTHGG